MKKILKNIDLPLAALILVLFFVVIIFSLQSSKVNAQRSKISGDIVNINGGASIAGNMKVGWRFGISENSNEDLGVYGGANFSDVVFANTPGQSQGQAIGTVSYLKALLGDLMDEKLPGVMPGVDW